VNGRRGTHFWLVELPVPPKASAGLVMLIEMAETYIQILVDQWGSGSTSSPPGVHALAKGVVYDDRQGGKMAAAYRSGTAALADRRSELLELDRTITETANYVADNQDTNFQNIKKIVDMLQDELRSVGSRKLSVATETTLVGHIVEAVAAILELTSTTTEDNQRTATSTSDTTRVAAATGSGGNGGGSGSGGLDIGSIISMLAVPSMAALPMATQLIEKLGNDSQGGGTDAPDTQTAGPAAPTTVPDLVNLLGTAPAPLPPTAPAPAAPIAQTTGTTDSAASRPGGPSIPGINSPSAQKKRHDAQPAAASTEEQESPLDEQGEQAAPAMA
ncbi:hypothetical protein AB0F41_19845, partial [Nocardia sp. NPDC024068]